MDPLIIAIIVAVFTLIVLFSGIPIAFGLSFVSIALLVAFEGLQMLDVFAETFYAGLNSFVLLSIPMFILMGMAVANSPAGKDLYTGLDRWLWRLPGGLVISNIGACSIFAALSFKSAADCACGRYTDICTTCSPSCHCTLGTGDKSAMGRPSDVCVTTPPDTMLRRAEPIDSKACAARDEDTPNHRRYASERAYWSSGWPKLST